METRSRNQAFTLIEVMIVTSVIAIIVAIAAPTWLRQREISRGVTCQENLTKIDGAKEQYALEYKLSNGTTVNYPDDLVHPFGSSAGIGYLKTTYTCPAEGTYTANPIGTDPTCSIGTTSDPFPHHVMPKS